MISLLFGRASTHSHETLLDVHIEAAVMVQTEAGVTLLQEAVTNCASLSLVYQIALSA